MFLRFSAPALLAGATALSLLASAASATPVSLTYNGPSVGDPKSVTLISTPVGSTGGTNAFGFNMTDSLGPLGSFVAWCLDLGNFLANTGAGAQDYKITSDPFGNSFGLDAAERARVQNVFDANFGSVDISVGNQAAAFQLALWDALYDGDWDLSTGAFQATASAAITGLAGDYLSAAAGWTGGRFYEMTFLESTGTSPQRQNLVTVSVVPVPAAGGLLLLALGGLAMARRRKAV